MERIVLHWTEGWGKANDVDLAAYHILIEGDGRLVRGKHSIEDNALIVKGFSYAAHTRNLNSRSIGVALCGMVGCQEGATGTDGKAPITLHQWQVMQGVVAELCRAYRIPVTPKTVLAHGEVQMNLGVKQAGKWDPLRWPWDRSQTGREIMQLTRAGIARHLAE